MRTKKRNFHSELLVPSKVQLQKGGTVFQQRIVFYAILRQSSRIGKQYANMLEKFDTWSQVFGQTFEALLTAARSSWSNSWQWERGKFIVTIRLLLNSEQPQQTYVESGEQAFRGNTTSQISVELLMCCRIFNTTPTTVLLKNISLGIQYSCRKKGMSIFPNDPSQANLQSLHIGPLR